MKIFKKTILVVEDELPVLMALKDRIEEEDFSVLTARNGQDGLEAAKSKHPDLILLDIIMPIMDGMTMLEINIEQLI